MKTNLAKQAKKLFASLVLVAVAAPVWAATQTVTLSVPGMTCAACPITVKKALSKVDGVSKIDVAFEKREAVVTFDDAKTSVQKLTKATEDAWRPVGAPRRCQPSASMTKMNAAQDTCSRRSDESRFRANPPHPTVVLPPADHIPRQSGRDHTPRMLANKRRSRLRRHHAARRRSAPACR